MGQSHEERERENKERLLRKLLPLKLQALMGKKSTVIVCHVSLTFTILQRIKERTYHAYPSVVSLFLGYLWRNE